MHHLIYPSKDTYITDKYPYSDKNFGLDEILEIGASTRTARFTVPTRSLTYLNEPVINWFVSNFSGSISGSIEGTASYISGSGTGTGSLGTGSFSGSSILIGSTFSGSVSNFVGSVGNFGGHITATVSGTQSITQSHEITSVTKYIDRALVQFDVSSISASIASGDISSPSFKLRLTVSEASELPVSYSLYAFAVSQSWEMGNGYYSDGGSVKGASWNYRNYSSGSVWYSITDSGSFHIIDFISNPSSATASWARGGGTWYTGSVSSQSFNYESGDTLMDVSPIVYSWISGSIPNNGFIVLSSEEFNYTGSETKLKFFSKDSNTIYQPILDVSWNDSTWVTGSVYTSSVTITTLPAGLLGTAQTGSTISGSSVNGGFNGTVNLVTTSSGAMTVTGFSGSIKNMSFYGNIDYVLSSSVSASISQSLILGTITNGDFSASVFTASRSNFVLTGGQITGSWNQSQLIGSTISASYPFDIAPNIIVYVYGRQVNGHALGIWQTASLTSGSFTGTMTDGPQAGANVYIPFTGSILTSSYSYTASVVIESSSLVPTQFSKPFVTVIQDLSPIAKSGNILRINVFSREEFPFKNFQRRTQFTQFITPKYLPTSSYYAIKDNETERMVIDFDSNTQISCDINGNFFELDTTGLAQERYYKILIKTEQSGSIYTFDRGDVFKIVR
jgi:hypothetical protein